MSDIRGGWKPLNGAVWRYLGLLLLLTPLVGGIRLLVERSAQTPEPQIVTQVVEVAKPVYVEVPVPTGVVVEVPVEAPPAPAAPILAPETTSTPIPPATAIEAQAALATLSPLPSAPPLATAPAEEGTGSPAPTPEQPAPPEPGEQGDHGQGVVAEAAPLRAPVSGAARPPVQRTRPSEQVTARPRREVQEERAGDRDESGLASANVQPAAPPEPAPVEPAPPPNPPAEQPQPPGSVPPTEPAPVNPPGEPLEPSRSIRERVSRLADQIPSQAELEAHLPSLDALHQEVAAANDVHQAVATVREQSEGELALLEQRLADVQQRLQGNRWTASTATKDERASAGAEPAPAKQTDDGKRQGNDSGGSDKKKNESVRDTVQREVEGVRERVQRSADSDRAKASERKGDEGSKGDKNDDAKKSVARDDRRQAVERATSRSGKGKR